MTASSRMTVPSLMGAFSRPPRRFSFTTSLLRMSSSTTMVVSGFKMAPAAGEIPCCTSCSSASCSSWTVRTSERSHVKLPVSPSSSFLAHAYQAVAYSGQPLVTTDERILAHPSGCGGDGAGGGGGGASGGGW